MEALAPDQDSGRKQSSKQQQHNKSSSRRARKGEESTKPTRKAVHFGFECFSDPKAPYESSTPTLPSALLLC